MVVGRIFLSLIQRSQLRENYRLFFSQNVPAHLATIMTISILTFEQIVEVVMHFFVGLKWVLQRVTKGIIFIGEIFKAFGSTRLKPWVEALVHHSCLHNLFVTFFPKEICFLFFILDAWSSDLFAFQDATCQVYFFL
jgi:hypothetical protein